jgi:3-oxoacyl-[acyl-carrier-protein] synthase II
MDRRRVVITGLGAVTPLGLNVPAFWEGLVAGKSGIAPITLFDAGAYPARIAGEVKGFAAESFFDVREAKRLDRFAQFALVSAMEAIKDSGLSPASEDLRRIGVFVGSGIGGLQEIEDQHSRLLERGPGKVSPFMVPKLMMNAASGQIAIFFGFRGPNCAVASACAAATHSIGEAARAIACGDADVMVTGGSEAAVTPLGLAGFCALKALSTRNDEPARASRPFDANRDGFVLGEGAAVFIIEEYERARARGARIYAEIAGYGSTCDAYHLTAPEPEGTGASDAMAAALAGAHARPEDVQYICAHGTSTELNDAMETKAIKRVFGDRAGKIAISSNKSMIGHSLGASGGMSLVVCVKAVETAVVPPTINYETPDPACDLDYVPNTAREMKVDGAMVNSFGFGGHNASLFIRRV